MHADYNTKGGCGFVERHMYSWSEGLEELCSSTQERVAVSYAAGLSNTDQSTVHPTVHM